MEGLVEKINRISYISHTLAKKSSIGTNTIEKVIIDENELENELVSKSFQNKNNLKILTVINFLNNYKTSNLIDWNNFKEEVSRLHKEIFKGISKTNPGKFKNQKNVIPNTKEFIDPSLVSDELSKMQAFINNSSFSWITIVALSHAKFIEIHPFSDGNGRIGRLISNKLIEKFYEVPLWIDEAMSYTLAQYISALDNFHFNGEGSDIVNYFIEMSIQQINRNSSLIEDMITKANLIKENLNISFDQAFYIVTYKAMSIAKFSKEFNIHRNTAKNILDKLVDNGYMKIIENSKEKIYRIIQF